MGSSACQDNAHISYDRFGQNAVKYAFLQMCEDQALPVSRQQVHRALAVKLQAAPGRKRLHPKVHLRVVTQRFEVSDALRDGPDGLPVDDPAGAEGHIIAEPLPDPSGQDFNLDLAVDLGRDFFCLLIITKMEHRLLFFQFLQILKSVVQIRPRRQLQDTGQDGLQLFLLRVRLSPEALPHMGSDQTRHRGDHARHRFGNRRIAVSRINPQFGDLFLILFCLNRLTDFQGTGSDFHKSQALSVFPRNLVNQRAEGLLRLVLRAPDSRQELLHSRKQVVHALIPQCGAEPDGEQLPLPEKTHQILFGGLLPKKDSLHQFFIQNGRFFQHFFAGQCAGEVHRAFRELRAENPEDLCVISLCLIHLVDEHQHRKPVMLQQLPDCAHMTVHALPGADQQHRRVQHLQRALHLRREIHMSRRIQQRDLCLFPERKDRLAREDRDAALPLHLVRVKMRVAAVHAAGGADNACVQQDIFR